MGIAKRIWMEQQEDEAWEERAEWIREQLNDPDADEFSDGWDELSEQYDREFPKYDPYDDDWLVEGKSRFEIFSENIQAAQALIQAQVNPLYRKNLVVMLYGHIVAAVEWYLSSTFINFALSSEEFMRRLVENDPEFAKRKFTVKEIFSKRDELKNDLREYLMGLIFHDIAKVKPMYLSVLGIEFGDVSWLFKAVLVRHHCVHRAGYDKDGNEVDLTSADLDALITKSVGLVNAVEGQVEKLPVFREISWENLTSP